MLDPRGVSRDADGMALSGTVPAKRRLGLDPSPATKWIKRLTWAVAGVTVLGFFTCFGTQRVPTGMDTVPAIRPGSLCIVDKRKSAIREGSNVFVDVPGGGTVLSRVTALDADTVTVLHPNPGSRLPDSRSFGPLPRRMIRSTVLAVFAPDDEPAAIPADGK